ncbi:MAG: tRNA (adenosine(37)-N6)-threonylcarbamoyltransferase complex ATPase subunit type 1 TsaE [Asticcacaulis sp.]
MQTPSNITSLDLTRPLSLYLPDEAATARLGALIASQLRAGDVVYLSGDLGAGKSSLARGLIRALTNLEQEVPSPTFTLIQAYETPAFPLLHLDLYRIGSPGEIYELGLDEALPAGVLVIEWPEKLAHLGFDDHLHIVLEQADKTNLPGPAKGGRVAHITMAGTFRDSTTT